MAASMLRISASMVSVLRPALSSARRGGRSVCRPSAVKAQSDDDLMKGLAAPLLFEAAAALSSAGAARAEDVTEAAAAAGAASGTGGGFGVGETVLLLAPVVVYGLFNVYREKINPQAKFLDYIYIMAALAIFGNIFSILVFKTRFF